MQHGAQRKGPEERSWSLWRWYIEGSGNLQCCHLEGLAWQHKVTTEENCIDGPYVVNIQPRLPPDLKDHLKEGLLRVLASDDDP